MLILVLFSLELQQQLLHARSPHTLLSAFLTIPTCAELPPEQQKADIWEWKWGFQPSGKVLVQGKKMGSLY